MARKSNVNRQGTVQSVGSKAPRGVKQPIKQPHGITGAKVGKKVPQGKSVNDPRKTPWGLPGKSY